MPQGAELVSSLKVAAPAVGLVIGAAGLLARAYRTFRRTNSDSSEPFWNYAALGLQYRLGIRLGRRLAAEFSLREYGRVALRSTAATMFVPARPMPVRLLVDATYVPLLLQNATREQFDHHAVLDSRGQRILIVGEPGSGKSSLMKRLFRDAARRAVASPRGSQLPVLIELRDLGRRVSPPKAGQDIEDIVVGRIRDVLMFQLDRTPDDLRSGAGYLILLDGLDEVPSQLAADVQNAIFSFADGLTRSSPQSTVVLTSRVQHLEAIDLRIREVFMAASIRPFGLGDVRDFLARWPFPAESRAQDAARVFARIQRFPSLTELCTNPLALSMFVAHDSKGGGDVLPETRTGFYAELLDELVANRRQRRESDPAGRTRLRRLRVAVLGHACLEHLLEPSESANSIPLGRLAEAVAASGAWDADDVLDVVDELSVDTGLFVIERDGETIRFLHLTLCEFLAAHEVCERGEQGWDVLLQKDLRPEHDQSPDAGRLDEVIAFGFGLSVRSWRTKILHRLGSHGMRPLLLRAAIEGQEYSSEIVRSTVETEASELSQAPPSEWDPKWWARLGRLILVLRDMGLQPEGSRRGSVGAPVELVSYLHDLMTRWDAERPLLATLVSVDLDAAMAMAEQSNDESLLGVIANSIDDLTVLGSVLERCKGSSSKWVEALARAALRRPRIAELLIGLPEDPLLMTGEPCPSKWRVAVMTAGSAYGQVLDRALAAVPSGDDHAGRREAGPRDVLRVLRDVDPPSSALVAAGRSLVARSLLGLVTLAIASVVLGLATLGDDVSIGAGLAVALAVLLLVVVQGVRDRSTREIVAAAVASRASTGVRSTTLQWFVLAQHDPGGSMLGPMRPRRELVVLELLNLRRFVFRPDPLSPDPFRFRPWRIYGLRTPDLRALREIRRERMFADRAAQDESGPADELATQSRAVAAGAPGGRTPHGGAGRLGP